MSRFVLVKTFFIVIIIIILIHKLTLFIIPLYAIIIYYADYILIKSDHECKSADENLGDFESLGQCANACKLMAGCNFFIYGKDSKQGRCYWEKTSDSGCPEGWEEDKYDFYELIGKFSFYHFNFSSLKV